MKDTKIEWADHSWSPWIGCTKVSPGCQNCYAEHLMDKRMGRVNWGKGNARKRTNQAYWKQPFKWDRIAFMETGDPELYRASVFPSLCDWLDPEVPLEWFADFLALIQATPNLRWLLLTKRPEQFGDRIWKLYRTACIANDPHGVMPMVGQWHVGGNPPSNVAIGVSTEDQQRWDERVPLLLQIPARWRFVSVEPMLGPITMALSRRGHKGAGERCMLPVPTQVIFGGESGPGARQCSVEWIRDCVRQCREAGVAAFVKQLGSQPVGFGEVLPSQFRIKHPKGGDPSEWPEDLRVREEMA